jgi:hypothetical protein
VIVNDRPPTVTVAVRDAPVVFCITVYVTVPLPLPPPLKATHVAEVVGVQAHPALAVTANDPVVASGPTDTAVGLSEYEQSLAAWLIVSGRPAIVRVARRPGLPGLDSTATVTVPEPVPVPPDGNVAHETGLDELHGQLACVVTVTGIVVASAPTSTRNSEVL